MVLFCPQGGSTLLLRGPTCTRTIRQGVLKLAHIALVSPRSAILAVAGKYLPIEGTKYI